MRIAAAVIILFVVGAIVALNLLTDNRTFTPPQVAAVTAACAQCHGDVPAYDSASRVHNRHAAFDCSRCHGDNRGLVVSDRVHTGLRWLGTGAVLLVLTGIIANSFIINKKGKVK